VVFAVSCLVFFVLHLIPGDPAQVLLGPTATAEDLTRLRHELGLDRSFLAQYVTWMAHVGRGDLGWSYVLRRPVLPEVAERFSHTMVLAAAAMLIAFPLGILLGSLAAARRGSVADRLATILASVGISMPSFWVGVLLIVLFSLRLGWLPGSGMYSPRGEGGLRDLLVHLVLPATTLALVPLAIVTRMMRTTLVGVLREDYMRTARAKGVAEAPAVIRHGLPNAFIPLLTLLGFQVGQLLAGGVYVETVFSWPGVGQLLVNAILTRDIPVVQGAILLVATTYVLINLATDLLYAVLDPRLRYG
jgi:ABC-type dipeptide/oligopeptide/nickel transport system permease component